MALQYPGYSVPQPTTTKLTDVVDGFDQSFQKGRERRQEADAPAVFEKSLPPLQEFGLPEAGTLREMFANPNTRAMAIEQVRAAQARRDEANDPMRKLQLEKAQLDIAAARRGPSGPGPTSEMRNFQFAQQNPGFAEFIGKAGATKAPAAVQEYLWYRENEKAAGREPMDYLTFGQAQKGNGTSLSVDPATGAVTFQQGGAPGAMPKLTEGQSKDVVYLTKGAGALPLIDQFGDALTNPVTAATGNIPGVGNYTKSPEYQQGEQAGKEFLAAVLRKDTGAAVTKSEEDMYGAMYLPRPGDSPEVLAQKQTARSRALKAIELGIPSQAIVAMESKGVELPGREPAQAAAPAPEQQQITDGTIIENDAGERLILQNGKWVPYNG